MEKLSYDLTTRSGLVDTKGTLQRLQPIAIARKSLTDGATVVGIRHAYASINIDFDIGGTIDNLIDFFKNLINRFFDVFDNTKKLEKQMELALKTIEISRAAGAKSIDITINSKNGVGLKLFLKNIDAKIGGQVKKDNSITYSIVF